MLKGNLWLPQDMVSEARGGSVSFVEEFQQEVSVPVQRVVSLVPSLTEAIATTAPRLLVGATAWCTHPADLDVERIGGTKNPDVPRIVALAPDLVVANEEENRAVDLAELHTAGIPVLLTRIRTVDEAFRELDRMLAEAVGSSGRGGWTRRRPRGPAMATDFASASARLLHLRLHIPSRRSHLAAAVDGAGPRHVRRRRAGTARRAQRLRRPCRALPEDPAARPPRPAAPNSSCFPTSPMRSTPPTAPKPFPACPPPWSPAATSPGTALRSSRRPTCCFASSRCRSASAVSGSAGS